MVDSHIWVFRCVLVFNICVMKDKEFKVNDVVVVHDHVCMNPDCKEGIIGVVIGYASCGFKDRFAVQIYKDGGRVTYKPAQLKKSANYNPNSLISNSDGLK